MGEGGDVILALICPPGFAVWHLLWMGREGGGIAVVYRNNVVLAGNPAQQQSGLECLYLALGNHDRTRLLLV